MQFDDFFSKGRFLNLPFYSARVSLNVTSNSIIKESFKLYNPFSLKARILKKILFFAVLNIPYFCRIVSTKYTSGKFLIHLEKIFKKQIHSSLYYPTVRGKIVLQLLTTERKVIGYVKIGLTDSGRIKIKNELQAIKELTAATDSIDGEYLISEGDFDGYNYLIVKEITGINRILSDFELLNELEKLDRKQKFILQNHPRFLSIMNSAKTLKRADLQEILHRISHSSKELYSLNYEHGDMAPWNVFVDSDTKIRFFDFEYFIKDGLQHLDFLNFNYQIAVNLKSLKSPLRIVEYIKNKIEINEFSEVFSLFLIQKILVNTIDCQNSDTENRLLEFISNSF